MGDAAHAVGDLSRATSLYLDGLQLIETIGLRYVGYWTADTTSARSVRADRILLGAIQRILDESHTKAQTSDLEQLLNDRLEAAKRDDDPFGSDCWTECSLSNGLDVPSCRTKRWLFTLDRLKRSIP
jgi:hypothetical protein